MKTLGMVQRLINCRKCGNKIKRHSVRTRVVRCLKGSIKIQYSSHYCPICMVHSVADLSDVVRGSSKYSNLVIAETLRIFRDGYNLREVAEALLKRYNLKLALSTIHSWLLEADDEN